MQRATSEGEAAPVHTISCQRLICALYTFVPCGCPISNPPNIWASPTTPLTQLIPEQVHILTPRSCTQHTPHTCMFTMQVAYLCRGATCRSVGVVRTVSAGSEDEHNLHVPNHITVLFHITAQGTSEHSSLKARQHQPSAVYQLVSLHGPITQQTRWGCQGQP